MMRRGWLRRVTCTLINCPDETPPDAIPPIEQMKEIPDRLDKIIQDRIRENLMEAAYLERLRTEARESNGGAST